MVYAHPRRTFHKHTIHTHIISKATILHFGKLSPQSCENGMSASSRKEEELYKSFLRSLFKSYLSAQPKPHGRFRETEAFFKTGKISYDFSYLFCCHLDSGSCFGVRLESVLTLNHHY